MDLLPLRALLAAIVPHCWDNVGAVRGAAKAGWRLAIVHGTKDNIVPVDMGRRLCLLAGPPAEFLEVPSASHNDVVLVALPEYARVMGLQL